MSDTILRHRPDVFSSWLKWPRRDWCRAVPARASGQSFLLRVARRIQRRRLAAGLTQEALALRLRIAVRNLQQIEGGKQNLTLETIAKIARVLDIDPDELVGPDAPPEK